jgi:hypothetical protein
MSFITRSLEPILEECCQKWSIKDMTRGLDREYSYRENVTAEMILNDMSNARKALEAWKPGEEIDRSLEC